MYRTDAGANPPLRPVVRSPYGARLVTAIAHLVLRRRRAIVFVWIALTLVGAYSASAVSKRWLEQFSIPGFSAYEANQRTLKTFGTGENAPLVAVFHSDGDVTKVTAIKPAIAAADRRCEGTGARIPRPGSVSRACRRADERVARPHP